MLVDPESWDLVSGVEPLLEKAADSEFADRLKPELMQCVARVGHRSSARTCRPPRPTCAHIRAVRRRARPGGRDAPRRLPATHPFSLYEHQKITARDRYRALVEMLQYVARRELVFGMHVHVAVPTPEACLAVMEGVLIELPVLLALSANSPFWRGERTGLPSTRADDLRRLPAQRPAAALRELRGLRQRRRLHGGDRARSATTRTCGGTSARTRASARSRCASWTARLASRTRSRWRPTCSASSSTCWTGSRPASRSLSYHRMLMAENKWLAARYGLDAPLMDLSAGKRVKMPARTLVKRRLRELKPIARELGCAEALAGIERSSRRGRAPSGRSRYGTQTATSRKSRASSRRRPRRSDVYPLVYA